MDFVFGGGGECVSPPLEDRKPPDFQKGLKTPESTRLRGFYIILKVYRKKVEKSRFLHLKNEFFHPEIRNSSRPPIFGNEGSRKSDPVNKKMTDFDKI